MVVGILDIKLALRQCRSLKNKRRILNSLKDRLCNKHNVSVSEVDKQDFCQTAHVAVAQVSSDARYVRGSLEKVVKMVRKFRGAQLTDYSIEVFHQ
ncbi:MAG: DUF503 domain-containing protein [Candidatus Brocadiia bacterium]|nr:DUF503 domain-containing protein [Planctomycetota bacterium]